MKLFDTMVDKAYEYIQESGDELKAILIPGDFNEHSLPSYDIASEVPNKNWPQMLETFRTVVTTLANKFPGVPILSAIGNNDCYYHDKAPFKDYANDYYSEVKTVLFDSVSANEDLSNSSTF